MSKPASHYANNITPKSYQPTAQPKLPGTLLELKNFVELFSGEAKKSKQKGDVLKVKRSSDILKFVINKIDEIFRSGYSSATLAEISADFKTFLKGSRTDAASDNTGHYYEMITHYLQNKRRSVEFTNRQEYLKTPRERSDIWILLEFNFHELDGVVEEITKIPDVKEMYRSNKGIISNFYNELQEILKTMKDIEFVIDSEVIKGYETSLSQQGIENKQILRLKGSGEVSSAGLKEKPSNLKKENSEQALNKLDMGTQPDYIETLNPNDPIVLWNMRKHKMNDKLTKSSIFSAEDPQKNQVATKAMTKSNINETNTKEAMKIINVINAANETLKHKSTPEETKEIKNAKDLRAKEGKEAKELNTVDSKERKETRNETTQPSKEAAISDKGTPLKSAVSPQKVGESLTPVMATPENDYDHNDGNSSNCDDDAERESKLKLDDLITPNGNERFNKLYDVLRLDENKNTPRPNDMSFNHMHTTEEKMKNSQRLYQEKFKIYEETFNFKEKPKDVINIGDQIYQCYSCHESISKGLYILWNNARYCYYSGYWYCSNCISFNKRPIPWKALEEFDVKSYRVCKEADREIECLYDKPILRIEYNSDIVVKNKALYEFMVLKRQIHLVYDMICDVNLMHDLMQDKLNIVLKQNLFSLKNLVDISNGSLTKFLEKSFSIFTRHIDDCKPCQSKGVICKICNSNLKVFPYDLKNSSICKNCKRLYHTRCLQLQNCVVCIHNF